MPDAAFVYGTLKTGECRADIFKQYLKSGFEVVPAAIKAELYDLGPFPGILHGDDAVYGELIIPSNSEEMDNLVPVLDRIEGYYGEGRNNLYNREVVMVEVSEKNHEGLTEQIEAVTYFFADGEHLKSVGKYMPNGTWGKACKTKETMGAGA